MPTTTQVTLTNSGSWTVPSGVYQIDVQCRAAGGAGGNSGEGCELPGGGGGGGARRDYNGLAVSVGQEATVSVGAAGTPGVNSGCGGETRFALNGKDIRAGGGLGASMSSGGGSGFGSGDGSGWDGSTGQNGNSNGTGGNGGLGGNASSASGYGGTPTTEAAAGGYGCGGGGQGLGGPGAGKNGGMGIIMLTLYWTQHQ